MDYYPTFEGMCEVVMNDEDEDAPSQAASESYLPPIPQFDLQSDHLDYTFQEPITLPLHQMYIPCPPIMQAYTPILDPVQLPVVPKVKTTPKSVKKDKKETSTPDLLEKREKKERKEFLAMLFPPTLSKTVFSKPSVKDLNWSKAERNFYDELFSGLLLSN